MPNLTLLCSRLSAQNAKKRFHKACHRSLPALTGHADGWVAGWALGEMPGAAAERRCAFPAFRGGAVTALCATAWGDLWAATSRGSIRCGVRFAGLECFWV